jgi:hypothetical protein
MSYTLLWIELLIVGLLLYAALMAVAAGRHWAVRALLFVPDLIFFLVLCGLCAATAAYKYALHIEQSWFGYMVSLLIAYVIGAVVIDRVGWRRQAGMLRAAAAWPRGRLVLSLITAVAVLAMTLWNMDLEARTEAAVVRMQAGAMMLSVAPPNIPDSQNAALLYENAFERLKTDKELQDPHSEFHTGDPDPQGKLVADLLNRQSVTLKLLRQAAALPGCQFDHNFARPSVEIILPELNSARTAAQLLKFESDRETALGNAQAAVDDINAIFALGRGVRQQPIILSMFVAYSLDALGESALPNLLPILRNAQELSAIQIGDVGTEMRTLKRSMQGEEAYGLSMFANFASGGRGLPDLMPAGNQSVNLLSQLSLESVGEFVMRVFFLHSDMRGYEQLMEGYQQWATRPYYSVGKEVRETELNKIRRAGLLTSIVAPALGHVMEQAALAEARHDSAVIAVALAHYRLDHGNLPPSLNALVPQYIDDVPADPFDGKPMRFVLHGPDCVIYSIGPDLKDDGGAPYDGKTGKGDIIFTLKPPIR